MPTPLHKELAWHREEIDLCRKVMAEIEAKYAPSREKDEALSRVKATLKVHEEIFAELEKQLSGGS